MDNETSTSTGTMTPEDAERHLAMKRELERRIVEIPSSTPTIQELRTDFAGDRIEDL